MNETLQNDRTVRTPKPASLLHVAVFVVLSYALSWTVWITALPDDTTKIGNAGFGTALLVGSFGPTVAGVIVTLVASGPRGLLVLLKRLVRVKFRWWIWPLAFFAVPVLLTAAQLLSGVRPAPGQSASLVLVTVTLVVPLNALVGGILLGVGPLGEEVGWRGLLTPALLRRLPSDVVPAVVVGIIWAFWHLPIFVFDDWRNGLSITTFSVSYPVATTLMAYSMIKLLRWTRGSILIAIVFHGVANIAVSNATDSVLWQGVGGPVRQLFVQLGGLTATAFLFAVIARTAKAEAITTGPREWDA